MLRGLGAWGWLEILNIFPSLKSALRVELLDGLVTFVGQLCSYSPLRHLSSLNMQGGVLLPVAGTWEVGKLCLVLESVTGFQNLVV